ncbi:MAG: LytTR family DNA-binding domain-containing protein [Pseudomonadota bacterium]
MSDYFVNRQRLISELLGNPRNLRLVALVLAFVVINQINDPLIDASIGQEIAYWSIRVVTLLLGLYVADYVLIKRASVLPNSPTWLKQVVLVSLVGLLPFSLLEVMIEPHLPIRPEFQDDALRAISPVLAWLAEYATIVSLLLPVHFVLWLLVDDHNTPMATPVAVSETTELPPFLESTGIADVSGILAMGAQEHYVQIYTEKRDVMVLCKFSDATKQMPGPLGLQVHRSWWVASEAVVSASRGARRWQLSLSNGLQVPVSDRYTADVRARGLLSRRSSSH